MKPNQIKFDGGAIVIQSCDEKVANIGVFQNQYQGKSAYHHVSIPDFVRDWSIAHYTDLPLDEYDRVLREHRAEILQTIQRLNEPCTSSI